MEVRYELVEKLKKELMEKLKDLTKDESKYKTFVEELIVQGMLRMMEKNVAVETRKEHRDLIVSSFENCEG